MFNKLENIFLIQQLRKRIDTLESEIKTIERNGYSTEYQKKHLEEIAMNTDLIQRLELELSK